jgi:hypothetical protein
MNQQYQQGGGHHPQQGQPQQGQQGQPQQGNQFSAPQVQASETTQFMTRAGQESKQRNISAQSRVWGPIWEARKHAWSFWLKNGMTTRLVLLTNPIPILAHEVYTKWITRHGGNPFAEKELARCTYYTFDQQGRWVQNPQGRPCIACKTLGFDPRMFLVCPVLDLKPVRQSNGVVTPHSIKYLETADDTVRETIYQSIDTWAPQFGRVAEPKFSIFRVGRSDNRLSPGVGDSWIFEQFADPNECQQFLQYLPNMAEGWPLFADEVLREILLSHIKLCDTHNMGNKRTYSSDGAQEVFGQVFGGPQGVGTFGQPQQGTGQPQQGQPAPQGGTMFQQPGQIQNTHQGQPGGQSQNPQTPSQTPPAGSGPVFGQPQAQNVQGEAGSPAPGASGGLFQQPGQPQGQPQGGNQANMAGQAQQGQGSMFLAPQGQQPQGQQPQGQQPQGQPAPQGTVFLDPRATMPQGQPGQPQQGPGGPSLDDLDDIDGKGKAFNPFDQSNL